jgi:hypothetical protein
LPPRNRRNFGLRYRKLGRFIQLGVNMILNICIQNCL